MANLSSFGDAPYRLCTWAGTFGKRIQPLGETKHISLECVRSKLKLCLIACLLTLTLQSLHIVLWLSNVVSAWLHVVLHSAAACYNCEDDSESQTLVTHEGHLPWKKKSLFWRFAWLCWTTRTARTQVMYVLFYLDLVQRHRWQLPFLRTRACLCSARVFPWGCNYPKCCGRICYSLMLEDCWPASRATPTKSQPPVALS